MVYPRTKRKTTPTLEKVIRQVQSNYASPIPQLAQRCGWDFQHGPSLKCLQEDIWTWISSFMSLVNLWLLVQHSSSDKSIIITAAKNEIWNNIVSSLGGLLLLQVSEVFLLFLPLVCTGCVEVLFGGCGFRAWFEVNQG